MDGCARESNAGIAATTCKNIGAGNYQAGYNEHKIN